MGTKTIMIGMEGMTLEKLVKIARQGAHVKLTEGSEQRLRETRRLIEKWVEEEKTIYGVTTGFGALSDVVISKKDTRRLQENILMSHAAGVGEPLDEESVRAAMVLRIKDFARGHSGVRLETVQHLIALHNWGVCPVIPAKGSVGASGDLAPLAHLSLVLIGLGEAFYKGQRMTGRQVLSKCGLKPIQLEAG
ncbi:MAG: aromatic amino acid lyase, partial [Desulfobacterales bacterium]